MNNTLENQIFTKTSPAMNQNKHFCFSRLAYFFFLFGTVFTVIGPVIHYSCYGLSLIFMLLSQFFEKSAIFKKPTGPVKTIFIWFFVFFLFVSFPNAINATSFYVWGKGASVFLEAILYTYMAFCLFDTDEKRKKLITWFAWANVIFAIEICLRPLYPMWFSESIQGILNFNGALNNGNATGGYATLLFPVFLICARFFCDNMLLESLLIFVALFITVCSFSVGSWGAGVVCLASFVFLLILKNQLRFKKLIVMFVIAIVASLALFAVAPKERKEELQREISQISAMFSESTNNSSKEFSSTMDHFTTHRDGAWKMSLDMILEKPIVGWGHDDFGGKSWNFFVNEKSKLSFNHYGYYDKGWSYDHPHNMYLAVAVAGGIPALLAFFVFALLLTFIAIRTYFKGKNQQTIIFALLTTVALITQAGVGLTGDLFCARRDIAVIFWAFLGVFLATLNKEIDTRDINC